MNSNPHVNISSGYVANSPNLKVLERIVCLDKIYSIQTSQKVLLYIFLLYRQRLSILLNAILIIERHDIFFYLLTQNFSLADKPHTKIFSQRITT